MIAHPPMPLKDAANQAELAIANRGLELSFEDQWASVPFINVGHTKSCRRLTARRVGCSYKINFHFDDGSITTVESGTVSVTPKLVRFEKA